MSSYQCSNREIARVTRYIKDDRYIASIFGVSEVRVKSIRENDLKNRRDDEIDSEEGYRVAVYEGDIHNRKMMERGSIRLLNAILSYLSVRKKHAAP